MKEDIYYSKQKPWGTISLPAFKFGSKLLILIFALPKQGGLIP
jgi:hypothetical protein